MEPRVSSWTHGRVTETPILLTAEELVRGAACTTEVQGLHAADLGLTFGGSSHTEALSCWNVFPVGPVSHCRLKLYQVPGSLALPKGLSRGPTSASL